MDLRQPQGYSMLSIALHWIMFFLLIAVYASIELREIFPKGTDTRAAFKTWHFMLGLSVFFLVWIRLIARWLIKTPMIEPDIPIWQQRFAKAIHFALYALMLGMPIAGWMILSAEGKNIPFFGFNLPRLMGENKALADTIENIHETAGTVGYFLIALHTFAGFFHHYIQRDNTLIRMLPIFISRLIQRKHHLK